MPGIEDLIPASLPSFFFGNAPANSPLSQQSLLTRRKIVESMLAGKRAFPKTIGEGITTVGEALGERRALAELDQAQAARQADMIKNEAQAPPLTGGGLPPAAAPPPARTSDAGTAAPMVRTSAAPVAGAQPIDVADLTTPSVGSDAGAAQYINTPGGPAFAAAYNDPPPETGPLPAPGGPGFADTAMGFAPTGATDIAPPAAAPAPDARAAITQALLQAGQNPDVAFKGDRLDRNIQPASPAATAGAVPFTPTGNTSSPEIAKLEAYGAATGTPQDTARSSAAPRAVTATAAARNAPITTDISPIPPIPPTTQQRPLVTPADQYSIPADKLALPAPPPERPKSARELYGEKLYMRGVVMGDTDLQALGQAIAAPETAIRNNLYQRDVTAYNDKLQAAIALQKMAQEKGFSKAQDETTLAEARLKLPEWFRGQQPGQQGPAPSAQVAGPGAPSTLPPGYDRRLGTEQSDQRNGVPPMQPNPGIPVGAHLKAEGDRIAKDVAAVQTATPQFVDMIDLLNQAKTHPGRKWGLGLSAEQAAKLGGSDALGFAKIMEQIGGKNFMNAYAGLRGSGQISNIEGEKATAAQARLMTAQNPKDFNKAMMDFENQIRTDFEIAQRKVHQPVTAWRQPGDKIDFAPDLGQIGQRDMGDGQGKKNVRYVGGNPRLNTSYREIQ